MTRLTAAGSSGSQAAGALQRWSRRLFPAFATASLVTALLVITLGGVVRVTGSGLGCPDWPLCHGRLIPPPDVKAWIEYTHRLSASLASVFVVLMAVAGVGREGFRRGAVMPLVAPVLLAAQAGLGAITVRLEINAAVALTHTVVAMAFLALLAVIASGETPWRSAVGEPVQAALAGHPRGRRVRLTFMALAVVTYGLLISGAYVYRSGAPLACLGYPLCGAPPGTESARGLQDIHMLHRYVALATVLLTAHAMGVAWRLRLPTRHLIVLAGGISGLMALQVALGASNVLFRLPEWARLGHLVAASLAFALIVLTVGTVWRKPVLAEQPREASRAQA
ncbi:MAG: heme A synthase [Dehalococcoidia bacterium]|nr:heme A synthase [Dehalococcoidia bacterium]